LLSLIHSIEKNNITKKKKVSKIFFKSIYIVRIFFIIYILKILNIILLFITITNIVEKKNKINIYKYFISPK